MSSTVKNEQMRDNDESLLEYSFVVIKDEKGDYLLFADHKKMVEVYFEQKHDDQIDPRFFWGVKEREDEEGEFHLSVVPIKIEIGPIHEIKTKDDIVAFQRIISFKEWPLDKKFTEYIFNTRDKPPSEEQLFLVEFVKALRETYYYKFFDHNFVIKEVRENLPMLRTAVEDNRASILKCLEDVRIQLKRVKNREIKLEEAKMIGIKRFQNFNSSEISRIEYEARKNEAICHQKWKLQWMRESTEVNNEDTLNLSEEEVERLACILREAITILC